MAEADDGKARRLRQGRRCWQPSQGRGLPSCNSSRVSKAPAARSAPPAAGCRAEGGTRVAAFLLPAGLGTRWDGRAGVSFSTRQPVR